MIYSLFISNRIFRRAGRKDADSEKDFYKKCEIFLLAKPGRIDNPQIHMENTEIQNVSDTAFWVASYRAQESQRPDALFKDPLAQKLAGKRGQRISKMMANSTGHYTAWTLSIRTVIIDNYIQKLVADGSIDTVINLGAGLDARPYRLNLPAQFRWIEADYPAVMKFKGETLQSEKPRCQLERISLDLADDKVRKDFLSEISAKTTKALILTEGVLPYLTPEQVSALAKDLHAFDSFQFWIVDYLSPLAAKYINSKKRRQQMRNAPFRFFPADWFGFFKEHGWKVREIRYLPEESMRLGRRVPSPWYAKLFMPFMKAETKEAFRKLSAYVLLEPTERTT
jgi:methyltransferase (TIGR00027 family)